MTETTCPECAAPLRVSPEMPLRSCEVCGTMLAGVDSVDAATAGASCWLWTGHRWLRLIPSLDTVKEPKT